MRSSGNGMDGLPNFSRGDETLWFPVTTGLTRPPGEMIDMLKVSTGARQRPL